MIGEQRHADGLDARVRRWAWVRTGLGWGQMAGATASVVLLVQTGTSVAAVSVVSVTAFFTAFSVVLFRVLKLPVAGGR